MAPQDSSVTTYELSSGNGTSSARPHVTALKRQRHVLLRGKALGLPWWAGSVACGALGHTTMVRAPLAKWLRRAADALSPPQDGKALLECTSKASAATPRVPVPAASMSGASGFRCCLLLGASSFTALAASISTFRAGRRAHTRAHGRSNRHAESTVSGRRQRQASSMRQVAALPRHVAAPSRKASAASQQKRTMAPQVSAQVLEEGGQAVARPENKRTPEALPTPTLGAAVPKRTLSKDTSTRTTQQAALAGSFVRTSFSHPELGTGAFAQMVEVPEPPNCNGSRDPVSASSHSDSSPTICDSLSTGEFKRQVTE
mmetsp:Transcript_52865/g.153838  ORF Transcript_52865/g.153838 Transcript_52865/m.153838 type:complete len:316 (-) Transcript_52865:122-1069(-)